MKNKCPQASKEAKKLYRALTDKGINPILEYWDEHKHVDMCIKEAKLFIEVDGPRHKKNYNQINSDLERDYWSRKQDYKTLRFTNQQINEQLDNAVEKIIVEVNLRLNK